MEKPYVAGRVPAAESVGPETEDRQQQERVVEGAPSLSKRVLRPRTLLSFVVAIGLVVFAISRFDLDLRAVLRESADANPLHLALAFGVYYGSFWLRSARWRSLLQSAQLEPAEGRRYPSLNGLSLIFMLSWFVNCLVPAKLGDAYRGFLLKRRAGTSFSGTLGTIFAERLADLVTLAVVLVGSGLLVFHGHVPARVSNWLLLAVIVGIGVVVGVLTVYRYRHFLRTLVPHRVRDHYVRLEEGALGSFGRLPTLLGYTAVIWLLEGVRFYFVSESVGAGLTFQQALFTALLASLLTAIPVTPAGLGFVEFGVVGTLTLMGVTEQTAASVAFLDRVVAYWSVIAIGGLLYLVMRWAWR